jgi:Holliday junction resolvase
MPHNKKDAIQNAIASGIDEISAERQALLDTLQGLYADAELVASITMLPSRAITAGNIAGTAAGLANTPLAAEQSGYPEEKTKQAKEKIDAAEAATEKNFAIYFRRIWQSATAEISDENLQNWIAFLKTASGKEYLATKKEVMETVFLDKANVVTEMITQRVKTKLREHIEERSAAYRQHLETKKEPSQDSPQASNP